MSNPPTDEDVTSEPPAAESTPTGTTPSSSSDGDDDDPSGGTDSTTTRSDSEPAAPERSNDVPGGRDVPVPLDVYKAITVFSTMFAVLAVVAGFVVLDVATSRASAAPEDVNVVLAVAGLGAIALGAVVYAFSTRFRAEGMGRLKDGAD